MKAVFLITELDYSGGPKMLAWVANQFAKHGDEVIILSIYSDKCSQLLEENVKFVSLNIRKSKNRIIRNTTNMMKVLYQMNRFINKEQPDMIFSFLYSADIFYLLINKFRKSKMIVSIRLDPYSDKGIASWVRYKLVGIADGSVFQTDGAREFFNKKIQSQGVVIPNPVTKKISEFTNKVNDFDKRRDIIVLPARLNLKQKRQDLMIDAFNKIHNSHSEMRLIFLGSGPDRKQIEKMIYEKNMTNSIEIHSAISDVEEYLNYIKDAKIVVLTSDYEGIPNSLIEAMGLGLTVVATDCSPGGARFLIKDGENGFLVERGNSEMLSKRICELLDKPKKADCLGKKAKEIVNVFSEEEVALKWIEYANHILHTKHY